jgi:hypothetical protein
MTVQKHNSNEFPCNVPLSRAPAAHVVSLYVLQPLIDCSAHRHLALWHCPITQQHLARKSTLTPKLVRLLHRWEDPKMWYHFEGGDLLTRPWQVYVQICPTHVNHPQQGAELATTKIKLVKPWTHSALGHKHVSGVAVCFHVFYSSALVEGEW